jgi:protein TonB
MARLPALATSLAVHAVAFAAVVLIPLFDNEPLPPPGGPPPRMPDWPLSPKIALADSPPRPVKPLTSSPRARATAPALDERAGHPPVANTFEETTDPIDSEGNICVQCTPDPSGTSTGDSDGAFDSQEPGPGGGGESSHVYVVGGQIRPPLKLRNVNPEYPDLARRAGIRGDVVLECLIDASGRITDIRVISGHPLLAPAATKAVSQWLYRPTELNDVAVPVLLTVTVRFSFGR